jgi:DNA repair exonuclease SbcCD nuclease subunit
LSLRLLHSSDVHVDDGHVPSAWDGDPLGGLRRVLDAAHAADVDAVLLAGDTFENNRLPDALIAAAAALVERAALPVVILPGNHDPLQAGSVFHRLPPCIANLHVLGATDVESLLLAPLGLELRGRAHRDHNDMPPLPDPAPRRATLQVIVAHGHYMPERPAERWLPSWLFTDADLAALGADYVALGHWNRHAVIGPPDVAASYSGSPDHEGTANLVVLRPGEAHMSRVTLG